MSTITAVLEADADGTLHLPIPEELRHGKVRVVATLQAEERKDIHPSQEEALAALHRLRQADTFRDIADPVAWQREIREDRPLREKD